MDEDEKFESCNVSKELLERAVEFHGHLGPFLVLGLMMSKLAYKFLKQISSVKVKTKLEPPRSCVLDGIQVATKCTLGNRKLSFTESQSEISSEFKGNEGCIVVSCKNDFLESLEKRMKRKEHTVEEEALNLLKMDEGEIFDIKKE
ncbi:MAG: formylmethanofuran dehydrogenase subunit E family protein [Candidatus Jordarchaeaceae archaeon]